MSGWQSVKDGLPISGPNDPRFDGVWYELRCEVMDERGNIEACDFWACWTLDIEYESQPHFEMEFAVHEQFNVLYWRSAE